jgi:putative ABC transport system permease protein
MIKNYLTVALRSVLKNRLFSILNIIGLVLSMTAAFLICLYVWYDSGYDAFHTKKDQIFRVRQDKYTNGERNRQWVAGPMSVGEDLKSNFPEVKRYVRMSKQKAMFSTENVLFREENVYFASPDFFKIFSFPLISGVDSLVLRDPYKMVISESMAKRYFGNADPVGKMIKNNSKESYEVVGVFKDLPENTHFKIDALMSFSTYLILIGPEEAENLKEWWWTGYYTYIELAPTADPQTFESKLPAFIEQKMGAELREYNEGMAFVLQPLHDIHLYSNFKDEMGPNGDGKDNGFLLIVAGFILIMAWINYINLSTAKSMERVKEIGVRKVLGSSRAQLIRQFLAESFIFKSLAFLITVTVIIIVLPYFSDFVNRKFNVALLLSPTVWGFVAGVVLLGVVLSGMYPAFVISALRPANILKGNFKSSMKGNHLRKSLVLIQFVCSIVLIIGTFTVYKQVSFIRTSNLGIDTEQVLVVHGPNVRDSTYFSRFNTFRQELLGYPGIEAITSTSGVPGRPSAISHGGVEKVGQQGKGGNSFRVIMIDEDYKDVYNLKIIAGRNFSREFNDNWKSVMINETSLPLLDMTTPEEALNQKLVLWGDTLQIVGVFSDFHHESPKKKIDQLIFICDHDISDYFSIKVQANSNVQPLIEQVEEQYKKSFQENGFGFFFLSDFYNNQYQSDIRFGKVFGLFSIVAVVIACLGLFGLSSYMTVQRTKEIGIRKVLGASARQLTVVLSREFFALILLANLLAWPLSYFLLNSWLNEFATRINLNLIDFVIPTLITMAVALGTVALQSAKAVHADPVDALRSE